MMERVDHRLQRRRQVATSCLWRCHHLRHRPSPQIVGQHQTIAARDGRHTVGDVGEEGHPPTLLGRQGALRLLVEGGRVEPLCLLENEVASLIASWQEDEQRGEMVIGSLSVPVSLEEISIAVQQQLVEVGRHLAGRRHLGSHLVAHTPHRRPPVARRTSNCQLIGWDLPRLSHTQTDHRAAAHTHGRLPCLRVVHMLESRLEERRPICRVTVGLQRPVGRLDRWDEVDCSRDEWPRSVMLLQVINGPFNRRIDFHDLRITNCRHLQTGKRGCATIFPDQLRGRWTSSE
mmetsp:Transcript_26833/g.77036  ORF Transcript_26833/g.77036 Transcript_26833/m.77036 type:complete len:289 (+) Transcript_26833:888-1754(+)